MAQRLVGEEEPARRAGIAGHRGGEVIAEPLAQRGLEPPGARDDGVRMKGVPELVIHDVGESGGVLAPPARAEEMDVVAVGVGIADVVDVRLRSDLEIDPIHLRSNGLGVSLDDERMDIGAELRVLDLAARCVPGHGAAGIEREGGLRLGACGGDDAHPGADEPRHALSAACPTA